MLTILPHLLDTLPGWIQVAEEGLEAVRLFGVKLINPEDFYPLVSRFLLNLVVAIILIRFLYYPSSKRKDYFFIYFMVSSVVFLVCFALENLNVQLGFALGLFAIFGILRYRTDTIPIKEMTYLFIMVGIAIVNALSGSKVSYAELLFTNLAIILLTWYLEKVWMLKKEDVLELVYEKIENVHAGKEEDLMQDLRIRTGLDIYRFTVLRINYLRDTARIRIFYRKPDPAAIKTAENK